MRLWCLHKGKGVGAAWLSGQHRSKHDNPGYAWAGTGYEHPEF